MPYRYRYRYRTDKEKVNQKETTARINALGVEMDLWNEFLGIRKKLKANNSTRGVNTLLNRIEKLVSARSRQQPA